MRRISGELLGWFFQIPGTISISGPLESLRSLRFALFVSMPVVNCIGSRFETSLSRLDVPVEEYETKESMD